jgi:hypothetical protein
MLLMNFICYTYLFAGDLERTVDEYKKRYRLPDATSKLVDTRGNGYENLRGLRNVRVVLHGIVYRGGAKNPVNDRLLNKTALNNLCKEGFGKALYMYPKGFNDVEQTVFNCITHDGVENTLEYVSIPVFGFNGAGRQRILEEIYDYIIEEKSHPIYMHCWNGWHAAGLMSAIILRQYCGYSSQQAVSYWISTTDNHYKNHMDKIPIIESFRKKNNPDMIKLETVLKKNGICPSYSEE